MKQEQIDELRLWHHTFKEVGELFEIRILGDKTYSGYFDDIEIAINALTSNTFMILKIFIILLIPYYQLAKVVNSTTTLFK